MIPNDTLTSILERMQRLLTSTAEAQYKTEDALPDKHTFTVGEYPADLDFLLQKGDGQIKKGALQLFKNLPDANGSTMMGIWFLSQSLDILRNLDGVDTTTLQGQITDQLECAKDIPKFFQGTTEDALGCPKDSMGWYPLIDGFRLPATIPYVIEKLLPASFKKGMSTLSDGDFWSWCKATDATAPDFLQYHYPINATDVYEPLLGSQQVVDFIDPESLSFFYDVMGKGSTDFPIGTYYNTNETYHQHFSTVVIGNILSSIPLQEEIPQEYMVDIQNAVNFVNKATKMAIEGHITWEEFAYDYYTIPGAPLMYVVRAHKRILEINRPGYPTLLDDDTLKMAVETITQLAENTLEQPALLLPSGAPEYATLVLCFDAMMNLRAINPFYFDDALVNQVMTTLLLPNTAANEVPGTGPYEVLDIKLLSLWIEMASICFIVPTLVEAYALYLKLEGDKN